MSDLIKKTQNFGVYIISIWLIYLLNLKRINTKPKSLLIIRIDSIGDYILFRNFLEVLKKNDKFTGYKITLCGNIAWKNLAETFDKEFVDKFVWLNRNKFYSNPVYKYQILKKIHNSGFEVVINSTYSREILFGDLIVRVSNAKERIGCSGSPDKHAEWKRNLISDNYYTTLLSSSKDNLFEFYRNKEFFENLLNSKINIKKPYFNTGGIIVTKIIRDKYVIIVPGAQNKDRIWNTDYFVSVARFIIDNYKMNIIISGSEKESNLTDLLTSKLNSNSVYNLPREVSLSILIKYIANAELLISNETGPVHIAAAVDTPLICISNGNYLGRFNPYPQEIFRNTSYIYPKEIENLINTDDLKHSNFRFKSKLDINEIKPDRVIAIINKILNPHA
ncbi:MAG: glycosyltransferase family 9 protein [Ignavibacteriaceae bacterium]|jgi:ADP-heptose:LPS heptosyltransferase